MPITQALNSKANVKKYSSQDVPFSSAQPVINSYYATSTAGQTSIANLGFSVSTLSTGQTDNFWLFVDGKKLTLGASADYVFAAIAADGTSSAITFNSPLPLNLNIQAYKMGMIAQSDIGFGTDNRFTQLFEAEGAGFQGFVNTTSFILTATTNTGTPAAGTFYSQIVNRASMVDLSQDLKARMGIMRIPAQSIYEIPSEAGPNGEKVWGLVNDIFGQIRLAGTWGAFADTSSGVYVNSSKVSDFIEVTFYGTGFNLLTSIIAANQDIRVTIDGGSESANIFPSTTTNGTVLTTRSVPLNQVLSCSAGLTLGVHTIKIRMVGAVSSPSITGFEIVNESSSLKIQPGVGYIQGKKLTTSAQSIQAYNASFESGALAARGGRVVVYQKADGSIAKAVTPTNASQANIASADHTNEEMIRRHVYREFGAGRADDFSTLLTAASTRAFTLDDDTTTLLGINTRNTTLSGSEAVNFGQSSTADTMTFTFIGTGLDVIWGADGTTTQVAVTVDGTSIGSFGPISLANLQKVQKVVSGLPYGTHVVKFASSNTTNSVAVNSFLVYQPKKPTIPAGAIELADYNVMATYVANASAGLETIGTGVLRKMNIRELSYVNTFTAGSIDVATHLSGFETFTTVSGAFLEYTFFGTGFELRGRGNTTYSATNTVSLQSLSTGGSLLTLNSTNFPGLTTSSYGGFTFTYASGNLAENTSNTVGSGMTVSGLTLGLYRIRVASGTANTFGINAIDVITPIHSAGSNLYADLQNTLAIGSNALSDNRKFTPVKEALPGQKIWAQAIGLTSGPTTTSTGAVPMPDMLLTVKTAGGLFDISYSTGTFNSVSSDYVFTQIYVDGFAVGSNRRSSNVSNLANVISDSFTIQLAPGTHTIALYWFVDAGTGSADNIRRTLTVRER